MEESKEYLRQLDIIKPSELNFPILIIGCGAIGSWTAIALAKLGCTDLTLVDPDTVELKNLPSQFYKRTQIGSLKVEALADNIEIFTGTRPRIYSETVETVFTNKDGEVQVYDNYRVVISAVDTLTSRRALWNILNDKYTAGRFQWEQFIDLRMAENTIRFFVVDSEDKVAFADYGTKLLNRTPYKAPCSAQSVAYNSLICGGLTADVVTRLVKGDLTKYEGVIDLVNLEIL